MRLQSNLRIFWLTTILLVLLTGSAASFVIKIQQSQQKVIQYFLLWEEDLGQTLVVHQNRDLLDKISQQLRDLDSSVERSYVQFTDKDNAGEQAIGRCRFQTNVPMSLSNFPVGQVSVCFRPSVLFFESLASPIFLFTLFLTLLFSALAFRREANKENQLYLANQIADLSRQVAHDVRGPLMALKTLSAHSDELPPEKAQLLVGAIGRIHAIADDLLRKSKNIKAAPARGNAKKIGFALLQTSLRELMGEFKARFPQAEINLQIETQEPLMIDIAETEIQRIVSNLVQNSVEASKDKTAIVSIVVGVKANFAILSILDSGCGMTEEQIQAALAGNSFGKENGNGLGLSSTEKIVRDHGGEFRCVSKVGVGTQITIRLPLVALPTESSVFNHKT